MTGRWTLTLVIRWEGAQRWVGLVWGDVIRRQKGGRSYGEKLLECAQALVKVAHHAGIVPE